MGMAAHPKVSSTSFCQIFLDHLLVGSTLRQNFSSSASLIEMFSGPQTMSDICNEFAKARGRCNYIEGNEWTDPTINVPDEGPIPHCAFRRYTFRRFCRSYMEV